MRVLTRVATLVFLFAASSAATGAAPPTEGSRNRPDRLEWFRDLGFGMFIHWSVDAPLGGVISHSLVGASDDYTRRFFEELPAASTRGSSIPRTGPPWPGWRA